MSRENTWRTRIYILTETGDWEDCGTGLLTIVKEEPGCDDLEEEKFESKEPNHFFKVITPNKEQSQLKISEKIFEKMVGHIKGTDAEFCSLYSKMSKDFIYNKQDTIISWDDSEIGEEIALSFLDQTASGEVWKIICRVTGRDPRVSKLIPDPQLPLPKEENLADISREFLKNKENFVSAINQEPQFLDDLNQLFERAEANRQIDIINDIHVLIKELSKNYEFRDFLDSEVLVIKKPPFCFSY